MQCDTTNSWLGRTSCGKSLPQQALSDPKAAAAPLSANVNVVICCVVVTRISVPSGVEVFNGNVIVPVANVLAG
jgi:hypothetical protein